MEEKKYIISGFQALGTEWHLEVFDELSSLHLFQISEIVKSEILSFQDKYSRFKSDSILNNLNYEKEVSYDEDLWNMLSIGLAFQKSTNNIFRLFIKKKLEDKGYGQKILREDKEVEVDDDKPSTFIRGNKIILNSNEHIDLGGIGKGFLIDKLARLLKSHGSQFFVINGGGDLYATSNFGKPIKIYLEHPYSDQLFIGEVDLLDQSLCVSSTNKRLWYKGGRLESHFVAEREIFRTASFAVSKNATEADILATVVCIEDNLDNLESLRNQYSAEFLILKELKIFYSSESSTFNLYK